MADAQNNESQMIAANVTVSSTTTASLTTTLENKLKDFTGVDKKVSDVTHRTTDKPNTHISTTSPVKSELSRTFAPFPAINKPPIDHTIAPLKQTPTTETPELHPIDFFDRYYKQGWPEGETSDVKVAVGHKSRRINHFRKDPFMVSQEKLPLANLPSVPDFLRFAIPMDQIILPPTISQRRSDIIPPTSYAQARYYD